MMKRFYKLKKRNKQQDSTALLKLATAPATVNVAMLIDEAGNVLTRYLSAVCNRKPEALPIDKMEETFYYEAIDKLWDKEGVYPEQKVELDVIRLYEYDRNVMYTVRSITYYAEVFIGQSKIGVIATYRRDERMGWLLERVEDCNQGCQELSAYCSM